MGVLITIFLELFRFLIICPEEEQLLRAGLEQASQQWPEANCQKGKFVVQ